MECEWNVQKRSSEGTTTTARETWRARCEDGCFIKTQTLAGDLMTQVLTHAKKSRVRNVRRFGAVFTREVKNTAPKKSEIS